MYEVSNYRLKNGRNGRNLEKGLLYSPRDIPEIH